MALPVATAQSSRTWSALAVRVAPIALVVVAAIIRVEQLGAASLWFDEAISWSVATAPWPVLLTAAQEPHPPLYYAFLKLWLAIGTSEAILRLPTAIVGVLDVWLTYALACRWAGTTAAAIAGLFVALSPLHVWYAREARMYEFVAAAAIGSTLLLAHWWSAKRRLAGTVALGLYALVALVGLYVNYPMVLVIVVQAIAVVGTGRLRRIAAFLAAIAVVAIGYLPWLPIALGHLALVRGAHFQDYAARLSELIGVPITGDFLLGCLVIVPTVGLLAAALGGRTLWSSLRPLADRPIGMLLLAAAPVGLLTLFGDFPGALTVKRQVLPLVPLVLAVAAVILARQPRRWVLVACLIALGLPGVWRSIVDHEVEPWRDVVGLVQAEARPDDLVLVHVRYAEPAFRYYYHGAAPVRVAPASIASLPATAGSAERVWLVLSRWQGPADPVVAWFDRSWRLAAIGDRPPLGLRLYERPSP